MKLAGFEAGNASPFFLISGPCVIEGESFVVDAAGKLAEIAAALEIPFIFKSSFDKANRSSIGSFRGLGMEQGLRALDAVRQQVGVPVLTDVHEDTPLAEVAAVVDVLQTPAMLCRQTNFIVSVASCGRPVNIKKGQFLSPWEMTNVVEKARSTGNDDILVCERGYMFGYNNLVSDMRSLVLMRETGCPVVFDAGHSVQYPGAQGHARRGGASFPPLRASGRGHGCCRGCSWSRTRIRMMAKSDGPSLALGRMAELLTRLKAIDEAVKNGSLEEQRV